MLVWFCLSENGKYDVTRKGKPSSTAPFSSLLLASVGGWSSTATVTLLSQQGSSVLESFMLPQDRKAPIQIIHLANPERTARAELRRRGRLHCQLLVSQVDPECRPPALPPPTRVLA